MEALISFLMYFILKKNEFYTNENQIWSIKDQYMVVGRVSLYNNRFTIARGIQ
jgi:hypothetical protein